MRNPKGYYPIIFWEAVVNNCLLFCHGSMWKYGEEYYVFSQAYCMQDVATKRNFVSTDIMKRQCSLKKTDAENIDLFIFLQMPAEVFSCSNLYLEIVNQTAQECYAYFSE